MEIEEAAETLGELDKILAETGEQVETYQNLRKGIEDADKVAEAAYQNCDHSDTGRALNAAVQAYQLKPVIENLYAWANKTIPSKIRDAFYTIIDKIATKAYKALITARMHLNTPKQKELVQQLLKTYKTAAGI